MNLFKRNFILVLFSLLIVIISCNQNKNQVEQKPTDKIETQLTVNPIKDIAGIYNPLEKTLYVLPDQKTNVLNILGAVQVEGDIYRMPGRTIFNKSVQITFRAVALEYMLILPYISWYDKYVSDIIASSDSTRGRYAGWFRDSLSGTFCRVYKDAKCEKVTDGFESTCTKEYKFKKPLIKIELIDSFPPQKIPPAPKPPDLPEPTGKYIKNIQSEVSHCLKGTNYCVEALVVTSKIEIYNDANCTQLLDTQLKYGYSCIK